VLGSLLEPLEQWRRVPTRATPLAARGPTRRCRQTNGSDPTSSPLPSYTGSEEQHHLQRRKRRNPVGFSFCSSSRIYFFSSLFWICFLSMDLLSFSFAFFSASAGPVCRLWAEATAAGGLATGAGSAERGKNGGWPREQEEEERCWEQGSERPREGKVPAAPLGSPVLFFAKGGVAGCV